MQRGKFRGQRDMRGEKEGNRVDRSHEEEKEEEQEEEEH